MNKEMLGTILALITALFSGIAIPANKIFVVDIDPTVFTAVRSLVIGVAFLCLSFAFRKRGSPKKPTFHWKYLLPIAVIGGAGAFLLYFTGLKLTTAGRAAFLHKTLPLYTALLAFVFLREKISKTYLAAMGLMVIGVVAIYSSSIQPTDLWSNPQLGDFLILSAAFLWGAENVISRKAMISGDTNWVVSFSRMFFGGLILFGIVLLTGKTAALFSLTSLQMYNIAISTGLLFAYVLFYYWSLRLINVSKAAMMLLISPVVSLIIGIAILHEPAPLLQLAGSGVILIGAFFMASIKSEERGI